MTHVCDIGNCRKEYKTMNGYMRHKKNHENDGWNNDQLELAMELSMKEKYEDFIPTDNSNITLKQCLICCENISSMVIIKCGHCILCYDCSCKMMELPKKERICPLCRNTIDAIIKIYFS